jgi:hypothetical protein
MAQIHELKAEIERLKKDQTRITAPTTPALSAVPLAERSHNVPKSRINTTLETIDLSSSSPDKSLILLSPAIPKKRPRAPDENQYRQSVNVALLPPPKFRNPGPSRMRHEVVERVRIRPKDDGREKPAHRGGFTIQVEGDLMPSANQLGLGQGGKLVKTGMKRRVRAA